MLEYPLLAALAAVVREGSFERAARVLHVTPSAVSQRVKLLEERVGAVLVVRGAPCSATATGRLLCRHAEQVGLLEQDLREALPALAAFADAGSAAPARPRLAIAVNADSLATWFVPAMQAFCDTTPALLDLSLDDEGHTAERLRAGEVLAAVCALGEPIPGCRATPLGALRYVATASPAFVARHFPPDVAAGEAFARAPALQFNAKDGLQARWVRQATGAEAPPLPAHGLPSSTAFVDAARAGLGWGMNPLALVERDLAAGTLVAMGGGRPLDVPLYWQCARRGLPALERLSDAVLAAARRSLVATSAAPDAPDAPDASRPGDATAPAAAGQPARAGSPAPVRRRPSGRRAAPQQRP